MFFKNIWTFSMWNVFKYSYFKSILPKIYLFCQHFAHCFCRPIFPIFLLAKLAHPYYNIILNNHVQLAWVMATPLQILIVLYTVHHCDYTWGTYAIDLLGSTVSTCTYLSWRMYNSYTIDISFLIIEIGCSKPTK